MADNQMQVPPIKVAFIIDGEVVDILHTDERLAAIFMSDPKVIDITDRLNVEGIGVTSQYDEETDTFTLPVHSQDKVLPVNPETPQE